ncbi:flagellar biosynthesis anti-sigma factor FlgM [Tissierella creatinophila]|uniref:Anti-sigma-28 factor, FlgM n=1 Tax=Tissierella creatinophila DSM 6911 TaxID=1123403 RepID=A0A1U7M2K2_TISCR|nr:flagellar biosynthesis anti-sigma factor FlgM [Tissierella creatinophila]OLS01537.1 anti-sigma-28 factor, FlgM [Tissierella creatinophila DSM 6911]
MKINNNYNNYNKYIKASQQRDIPREETKTNKEKNINVQISNSTRKLVDSMKEVKEKGISERVENIRKAILKGKYEIDDKTIAKKIMDNIYIQEGERIDE